MSKQVVKGHNGLKIKRLNERLKIIIQKLSEADFMPIFEINFMSIIAFH